MKEAQFILSMEGQKRRDTEVIDRDGEVGAKSASKGLPLELVLELSDLELGSLVLELLVLELLLLPLALLEFAVSVASDDNGLVAMGRRVVVARAGRMTAGDDNGLLLGRRGTSHDDFVLRRRSAVSRGRSTVSGRRTGHDNAARGRTAHVARRRAAHGSGRGSTHGSTMRRRRMHHADLRRHHGRRTADSEVDRRQNELDASARALWSGYRHPLLIVYSRSSKRC